MKQCLVMQHVAFEDMGTFAPVREEKGFAIRYCPVDEPPTEEEWLSAELAVVLGGAIGVPRAVPVFRFHRESVQLQAAPITEFRK